jgi:hypothetical protein
MRQADPTHPRLHGLPYQWRAPRKDCVLWLSLARRREQSLGTALSTAVATGNMEADPHCLHVCVAQFLSHS